MSNFKCLSSGEIQESLYTVREIYSIRLQANIPWNAMSSAERM